MVKRLIRGPCLMSFLQKNSSPGGMGSSRFIFFVGGQFNVSAVRCVAVRSLHHERSMSLKCYFSAFLP